MAVQDSIFGSKSEERGYRAIERTWGGKYAIYPQIPLSALFTPDPNWRDTSNYFFKTSVDYVLCSNEGRPILAIDFDGLGGGFDRNGEYVQVEATQDRYRKLKFDFKLRFARENNLPYHIVSSDECNLLGKDVQLTVVDAIISQTLVYTSLNGGIQSFIDEYAEEIDMQPDWYKGEYVQDLVLWLETDLEAEHSVIWRKKSEVLSQIHSITGTFSYGHSFQFIDPPGVPSVDWGGGVEEWKRRFDALDRAEVCGCLVTIFDTPVGEVSEIFKMRNLGYSAPSLVSDIGDLMAWSKLLRLLRRHR